VSLKALKFTLISANVFLPITIAPANAQQFQHYQTTLLVSSENNAPSIDPNLEWPRGITRLDGGLWWVVNNRTGVATNYPPDLARQIVVTIPAAVPGAKSTPNGIVANGTSDFSLSPGMPAELIFATEDGTISAWNRSVNETNALIMVNNSSAAQYTGLTMDQINGLNYLYAANFSAGTIDVFDAGFRPFSLPAGAFKDDQIPSGFGPYNVQALGSMIAVTFAEYGGGRPPVNPTTGPGLGYVDIFDSRGNLLSRLQHGNWLSWPSGVAIASSNFGIYGNALLVATANSIVAYNPHTGNAIGQLETEDGGPLTLGTPTYIAYEGGGESIGTMVFVTASSALGYGVFGTITPTN
jgi:uncharacterized protein (TIGR03118 family)